MRCFLAVVIPDGMRRSIAERIEAFRAHDEGIRWVTEKNIHLTLKFLGECDPATLERISEVARNVAGRFRRFAAVVGGAGVFPDTRRPQVLWIGILEPPKALFELAKTMDERLAAVGIPRETHPYRAHLTVGRMRRSGPGYRRNAARAEAEALSERWISSTTSTLGSFGVDKIDLMESKLAPQGAVYTTIAEFPLIAGGDDADKN